MSRRRKTAEISAAVAWFNRTGHCFTCGQPGNFCLCRTPCECWQLHTVGSGLDVDALERFTDNTSDGDVPLFDIQPGGTR